MLKRYSQIVILLQKYGFGYIADQIGLTSIKDFIFRFKNEEHLDRINASGPVRVRMLLEELGPTYIKVGQLLSVRHDVIPLEYILELSKLQDSTPSFSFEEAEAIIIEELRNSVDELFEYFDREPLACASIGQVHKARLKNGDEVVVKIQRPGIKEVIRSDLDIMHSIAKLLNEYIPEARLYRPVEVVNELSRSILAELDYKQEGWNAENFASNFKNNTHIYIPKVYWDYTSNRVLTLQFIKGIKGNSLELIKKSDIEKKEIASVVANSFMQQIFKYGFFHADLHPGNIFVMEDNNVAFIDYGMIGHLSTDTRNLLFEGTTALVKGDISLLIEIVRDMDGIDSYVDINSLKTDVEYFRSKYYGRVLKNIDSSKIIDELTGILRKNQVKVPYNITLLVRGLVAVEGFGLIIDPDFNLADMVEPYVKKSIKESFYPHNMAHSFYNDMHNWSRVFKKAPTKISHILDHAENGYFEIKLESETSKRLISQVDIASNRLSFSLIISAIIVASSTIIQTNMKPLVWNVPLLGLFGFLLASIFGIWLVLNIFRTGKI